MELPLDISTAAFTAILALALSVYFLSKITRNGKRKFEMTKTAPKAAGAWPVIGHLHLLGGRQLLHQTFGAMADKFGPIFTIKLGVHPAIVVSDWELAKECFTTNDAVFSNRPKTTAIKHLGFNYANFGFGPYGSYWRQLRKIIVVELLSNRRLEFLGPIRRTEVKTSIREIYVKWVKNENSSGEDSDLKVLVDMKKWFGDLTLNVILRIVAGKRIGEEEEEIYRFQKAMVKVFDFMGLFLVSDALPFLRWLDLGGHERAMKRTAKEINHILQNWLDEHKQKGKLGAVQVGQVQDFMDILMSAIGRMAPAEDQPNVDADTINKANCLGTLIGGTDTTTVTLTWALSLLLNHPHVLKKAQEELDLCVGKDRRVEDSDLNNLVYLQAVVKETLRLYPPGPLLGPRESMEDCTLGGYHIPKGTRLVVNAWKIQRDPRIYTEPDAFKPERWITEHKDVDVRGQNFELIPFGCGRRICAGISLAMQVLQFTLATLLHGFEFSTLLNEPIDMSESPGLSNLKATALEVLVAPRLSASLYE